MRRFRTHVRLSIAGTLAAVAGCGESGLDMPAPGGPSASPAEVATVASAPAPSELWPSQHPKLDYHPLPYTLLPVAKDDPYCGGVWATEATAQSFEARAAQGDACGAYALIQFHLEPVGMPSDYEAALAYAAAAGSRC